MQNRLSYSHFNGNTTANMSKEFHTGLMWFRRDLRTDDNAALFHALKSCKTVHCVFIFDREILDSLPRADRRVEFIRESLVELDESIRQLSAKLHGGLIVQHAWASDAIPLIAQELAVQAVFTNHDYEPQAVQRDAVVLGKLAAMGVAFHTFKDHVIFERTEVLTQMGKPYGVFTPYKNACLKKLNEFYLKPYPVEKYANALENRPAGHRQTILTLESIGFKRTNLKTLKIPTGMSGGHSLFEDFFIRMDEYHQTRDFPAVKGPSYLGVHLRFGTISIRKLAATAHQRTLQGSQGAAIWLSELIWRDFYFQILSNFPHAAQGAFKPEYNAIKWEHGGNADSLFAAWCEGRTGYPLVDAAMAQINQTGYMHNRLRMVVASFLVKDLGIDWRWGERYFAEKLNDFDLSANNGGWQWASSSGCDAQPYFRIFNPTSQSEKFDSEGKFIRKYLPQLSKLPNAALHEPWNAKPIDLQSAGVSLGVNYPYPIINHTQAREKTLLRYAVVKKSTV
jgi:deoxyribodipyrimidine photo-lyase